MNKLTIYPIAIFLVFFLGANSIFGQFNVKINVLSGSATTTCTDPIGSPDPTWAVNIDNAGWVVYPFNGLCYTTLPNQQFSQDYACFTDVPATIQVCYRAFENDASIFSPCTPVFSCATDICIDVPVPPMGTVPFTISLPAGGQSGGNVNLEIVATGVPNGINDFLCNAVPLGILQTNVPVGFPDTSVFSNICATNTNEPNPSGSGTPWSNNQGVWFSFITGPNPSDVIFVDVNSDPSNFGDPINLQVAVYESSNGSCTANFSLVNSAYDNAIFDESTLFYCPKPNTTYFILIDGVYLTPQDNSQVQGLFGLGATQLDVTAGEDVRCNATDFGAIPAGDTINSPLYTNTCSSNVNAASNSSFTVQKSVWFKFTPPPSGHVLIEGISSSIDPISLQLAVFKSSNGLCNGTMQEVDSQFNGFDENESLELHCLDPNTTYYLEVDGGNAPLQTGIFSLNISDAGDETPVNNINPVICAGESFTVGTSVYSQSGLYADTLQLPGGCDSIVNTNLTVLTPVVANYQIVQQGVGIGNTTGQASATGSGGSGPYSFAWSNGQTTNLANGLVGGDNYCVTATDQYGCSADTCFDMPYYIHFVPSATGSSLACNGDMDGTIEFSAIGGYPPYQFDWENLGNSLSGSGTIQTDGEVISLPNLPGGQYSIHLSDAIFDTTVLVQIFEPTKLTATTLSFSDITCFGGCDGSVNLDVQGGTPPYSVSWSNGATTQNISGLCVGSYQATVTDANGCSTIFTQNIQEPPQLLATASEVQAVSCFQGNDGEASVTTSQPVTNILWNNGETTPTISSLVGGTYDVTVTNAAGCTATASIIINTPSAPVGVVISESKPVVCMGDSNGELLAQTSGPGTNFTFAWSGGSSQNKASNLAAGSYSVTVTNENGCSATANFNLTEPTKIEATATPNELTCLDLPDAGVITVDQVTGGVPTYQYSSNGISFSDDPVLQGFTVGDQSFYIQDQNGCIVAFQETILGPLELVIDLGHDESIHLGDSLNLKVTANQPLQTYVWSPAEGLSCVDCANPAAQPFRSTTYQVVVTSPDGCTALDEIFIEVDERHRVYLPNAFSPNADGLNDEFMPYTDGSVRSIKSFRIFDRQGNNVFEAFKLVPNEPGFGWDGSFRGKQMQPGVFVWIAELEYLDGRVQLYKGDILLVK